MYYFQVVWRRPGGGALDISKEYIQLVVTYLSGSARSSGKDEPAFQIWLLHFGQAYAKLRVDMEEWADWTENDSPLWAAYWAVIEGGLINL